MLIMMVKKNIIKLNMQWLNSICTVLLLILPYTSADGDSGGFFALTSIGKECGIYLVSAVVLIILFFLGHWLWAVYHRERPSATQQRPYTPGNNNVTAGDRNVPVFKHPDVKNIENVLECVICLISNSGTCPVCRFDLKYNVPETTINAGSVVIDVLEAGEGHTETETEMVSETQDELANVTMAPPVFATSSSQG
ncbi:hypothetical protein MKW92_011056 [Papaver armeniacum]|nr:hypothetical protein MKW92_011056 [Papaver armeniacum]